MRWRRGTRYAWRFLLLVLAVRGDAMRCDRIVDSGPYVLGALAPAERAGYERHLAHCPTCRGDVAELAGLPGLLGRLEPAAAQRIAAIGGPPTDPPDPLLLSRVVAAASRRRRVRRFTWVSLPTAFAAACVALVVVLGVGTGGEPLPQAAPSLATMRAVAGSAQISAEVALTPVRGGTQIQLHCWYARTSVYTSVRTFRLYVYPRGSGPREQVSSWTAGPGDDLRISAVTHLATIEVATVEVDSDSGEPLLSYQP